MAAPPDAQRAEQPSPTAPDSTPATPRVRGPMKRGKRALIYAVVAALIAAARQLPPRLAVAIGAGVGLLAGLLAGRERRRALRNVQRVWPALPRRARRALVRRMFVNLGRSALECVVMHKLDRGRAAVVRFTPGSLAALRAALARGRGVVYVTGHVGNWELMARAVAAEAPVYVLARSSYDPRFTRLIDRFRRANGVVSLWVEDPGHLRAALRALRSGAILGVLVDQPLRSGGVGVPFLGHPAATTTIAAALARASGAPLVAGFIRRTAACSHEIDVRALALGELRRGPDGLLDTTRRCSSAVESAVGADPSQWLWSLDRWRGSGSDDARAALRESEDCAQA